MPRRDILDLSAYQGLSAMGVQTKRGCALDCLYCTYPFLSGRNVRLRSPEKVGEELEVLCRDYGRDEFFFADHVFNLPMSHAEVVCQEILRRKLSVRWTGYFWERGMTADFVSLALESGCVKFTLAPDASDDVSLRELGKGVTRGQLEATYCLLEGVPQPRFACGFVWNYPQAGWKDVHGLASLLMFRLLKMKNQSGLGITTMRILPNTCLHDIAVREGRVEPRRRLADADLLRSVSFELGH